MPAIRNSVVCRNELVETITSTYCWESVAYYDRVPGCEVMLCVWSCFLVKFSVD
jgi:hypothetical protein